MSFTFRSHNCRHWYHVDGRDAAFKSVSSCPKRERERERERRTRGVRLHRIFFFDKIREVLGAHNKEEINTKRTQKYYYYPRRRRRRRFHERVVCVDVGLLLFLVVLVVALFRKEPPRRRHSLSLSLLVVPREKRVSYFFVSAKGVKKSDFFLALGTAKKNKNKTHTYTKTLNILDKKPPPFLSHFITKENAHAKTSLHYYYRRRH